MQARIALPHYTYEDYCHWQGDWELIQGIPYAMSPSPLPRHYRVQHSLISEIETKLKHRTSCALCEVFADMDWKVAENTVVRPDIMLICAPVNDDEVITHPPALIIEVLSPSTRIYDQTTKFALYATHGVRYYLMADPLAPGLKAYELVEGEYVPLLGPPFELEVHPGCKLKLGMEGWTLQEIK